MRYYRALCQLIFIDEIKLNSYFHKSSFVYQSIKKYWTEILHLYEILNKSDFLKINKLHNLPDPSVESDVGEPEGPDPDEAEEGLVLVE